MPMEEIRVFNEIFTSGMIERMGGSDIQKKKRFTMEGAVCPRAPSLI
jgi:hypothetical protein